MARVARTKYHHVDRSMMEIRRKAGTANRVCCAVQFALTIREEQDSVEIEDLLTVRETGSP